MISPKLRSRGATTGNAIAMYSITFMGDANPVLSAAATATSAAAR